MCIRDSGLQRVLGLGSYRTAWSWLHKLRRAMVRPDREAMNGVVEVDETIIGGVKRGHKGRGDPRKTLVAIAAEVRDNGPGRVRMKRIPNASEDVLTDFVLEHVERGAEVHTDAWAGYNGIGRHRFDHVITNVATSEDPAHVLMPEVHRVISLLKRWLMGTHQGGVSHKHLDYYLDEFTFRFNRRKSTSRGKLFYRLAQQAVAVEPAPYDAIVQQTRGQTEKPK